TQLERVAVVADGVVVRVRGERGVAAVVEGVGAKRGIAHGIGERRRSRLAVAGRDLGGAEVVGAGGRGGDGVRLGEGLHGVRVLLLGERLDSAGGGSVRVRV